jgi:hypothetical protein
MIRNSLPSELKASTDKKCKAFTERRRVLEQARSVNVRRIQQEVQRIAQREIEYAQRLLSEYAPVKLSLNEDVWNRWQEFMPIRVEFTDQEEKKVDKVVSTNDEIDDDNRAPSSENM